MALVVQTNPPTAGANSYAAVSRFKAYHDALGNSYASKTDDDIEKALVRATQFVDVRFSYVGWRVDPDQDTEWPRQSAFNDRGDLVVGLPKALIDATCEYALRALNSPLISDPERDDTGRQVRSKTEEVGPIKTSVEYESTSRFELPAYPLADQLLKRRGLVDGYGGSGMAVGTTARA